MVVTFFRLFPDMESLNDNVRKAILTNNDCVNDGLNITKSKVSLMIILIII